MEKMEVVKLEVRDSFRTAKGGDVEESEPAFPAKNLEKKPSLSSVARSASLSFGKMAKKVKNATPLNRLRSVAVRAVKGINFISQKDEGGGWAAVEKRFNSLSAGMLPRSSICECIGIKESEFAERLLDTLAKKQNIHGDTITKEQLQIIWDQISDQNPYAKLRTFFDMLDKDADGLVTVAEVKEAIILSASSNKLDNLEEHAEEFAALIVEALDSDKLGYIKIDDLEEPLSRASTLSSSIGEDTKNPSHVQREELNTISKTTQLAVRLCKSTKYFVVENWKRIWVMALWIGAMAGLFAYKYAEYRNKVAYQVMGECVCMAKGAAETLKLNMALILLPVCRNTITWLRNKTKLGSLVPFDDNLNFHQVIAIGIAVGTGIHVLAHMSCDFPRLIRASSEEYKCMEPFFGKHQQKSYFNFVWSVEGVTGIVMVLLMAVAFTLAAPCFRTAKCDNKKPKLKEKLTGFNAFWYSHHLFVIVYALFIVHGLYLYLIHKWYKKTTWMYLAVPVTLYGCERLIRALRSTIKEVTVLEAPDYPGNVLALHMSKPQGFTYRSGQYMFIKCKAVSPFEWHPFSITTCPADEYLSVHIRALGDWTKELKTLFDKARKSDGKEPKFPKISIDGPYGAPAQEYKNYEVVMLVGTGIGATPMISIVKDIVNNIKSKEPEESKLEKGNSKRKSEEKFKTRKVYFHWLTPDQRSFYWFKKVMDEVAKLDHKGVIEIHHHCTQVYQEGDIRLAFIAMLQAINLAKDGLDVVSGTRVQTHFVRRPNWHDIFQSIQHNNLDTRKIGVFYCGTPAAVNGLKQQASYFSQTTTTEFDFHKENF